MQKYTYYNPEIIQKFYKTLRYTGFKTISDERKLELDQIVNKWRYYFVNSSCGLKTLMNFTAEKMMVSSKRFGLLSGDEKAFFYIKIIDPDLLFLEAYEKANTISELHELCFTNFHLFDKNIIIMEKYYNERFCEYCPDDIWALNRIKNSEKNSKK